MPSRLRAQERLRAAITAAQLHDMQQHGVAPLVIDVRSAAEFAEGRIPGAVNISNDELAERVPKLDTAYGIVVYGPPGPRAQQAKDLLRKIGYTRVFHLEGGLAAWERAGLPVRR